MTSQVQNYSNSVPIAQNEIKERERDLSFNSSVARIKRFTGGIVASSITGATNQSIRYIAKYFKIIPEEPCFFWNDFYDTVQKGSGIFMSQLEAWKGIAPIAIICGGIGEELIFREVVQNFLLKELLGKAIQKVSPNNASWVDTKAAKIFRITITATLFAGMHLATDTDEIPLGIKFQAFNALAMGFILGAIKESQLGLIGSIGCHMMHNAISSTQIYIYCVSNNYSSEKISYLQLF